MNKQILLTLLLVSGSVLPGCLHSPDPSRESVAIAASTHTMDSGKPVADGRLGKAEVAAAQPNTTRLQERLNNVDLSSAQGNVGIGVLDLNTGERWFSNGKQRFPMQSVFKLPVGIVVLKLVDEGKLSLNQTVTITRYQFAPGWNPTALLLKIMTDTPTGQQRLKAGLPPGWSIAHKTGTGHDVLGIGIAANNVGLISSPTGKHVAIAVFIAGSKAPLEQRESVMSAVASAVIQAMQ